MSLFMPSVTIGVVSAHTFPSPFLKCLFNIISHTNEKVGEVSLSVSVHPFMHVARNSCAMEAISNNSDYLFFLDADVFAPPDTIEKLVARKKGIISGPCHYKLPPYPPLRYKRSGEGLDYTLDLDAAPGELSEVDAVSAGCLLISREVLEKLGMPLFDLRLGNSVVGEDIFFCHKARQAGWSVWYDGAAGDVRHFGAAVGVHDFLAWQEQVRKGKVEFRVKGPGAENNPVK